MLNEEGGFDVWVTPRGGVLEVVRSTEFTFEAYRGLTASANGDAPAEGNRLVGTASSGAFSLGRTATYVPLASNDGDTEARRIQIVSHYRPKVVISPEVIFDLTVVASSSNRLTWLGDSGATAYNPATDGTVDYFVDGELEDDIAPHQYAEVPCGCLEHVGAECSDCDGHRARR